MRQHANVRLMASIDKKLNLGHAVNTLSLILLYLHSQSYYLYLKLLPHNILYWPHFVVLLSILPFLYGSLRTRQGFETG